MRKLLFYYSPTRLAINPLTTSEMNIKEILDLYLSGDIYNADALSDDVFKLLQINTEVVQQATASLAVYSDRSLYHSPEEKVTIFNNYVSMLSISSYLDYRIKKLEEKEGGASL